MTYTALAAHTLKHEEGLVPIENKVDESNVGQEQIALITQTIQSQGDNKHNTTEVIVTIIPGLS